MHIRSYFDYDRELPLFLSCLPPAAGLRFGVSCLQRFRELFGSSVAKELEPTLSEPVRAAYQDIETALDPNHVLSLPSVASLRPILTRLSLQEHPELEGSSYAPRFLASLDSLIRYCASGESPELHLVGMALIDMLDFEYGQNYPLYSAENMFTFPEFQQELQRQVHLLSTLGMETGVA